MLLDNHVICGGREDAGWTTRDNMGFTIGGSAIESGSVQSFAVAYYQSVMAQSPLLPTQMYLLISSHIHSKQLFESSR